MRVRSWRLFAIGVVVSVAVGGIWTIPVGAATRIRYSGQSVAVRATVSSTTTVLADTGSLSSSGGALEASSGSGLIPQTLTADTLHASTIGQGDRTRSEASVANVVATGGATSVSADLAMSRSTAVSQGVTATVSGLSHVDGLTVNGVPIVVTGQPNQIVPLVDGQLTVNEQITSGSGDTGSITVNALHLQLSGGTDILLGSSRAGVTAGPQNCSSTNDFATGGGWLSSVTPGPKRTFGFIGGLQGGSAFLGHFLYVNRATNERVEGRVNLYLVATGTTRHFEGQGQVNSQSGSFQVDVTDNGEPGTQDTFSVTYQSSGGGSGADSGTLGGGNVQVHVPCR